MKKITNEQALELPKLEQSALLDLYTFDLTEFGGEIYHLCNDINEKGQAIVFDGIAYNPYPIEATGFAFNSQGASNRPSLGISNMHGLITSLVEGIGVVGAKVIRKQVYAKHLDAVNFFKGNVHANTSAVVTSLFIVECVKSLNRNSASLELAIPTEADGIKIPRRIIISNTSPSAYKTSTGVLAYRKKE